MKINAKNKKPGTKAKTKAVVKKPVKRTRKVILDDEYQLYGKMKLKNKERKERLALEKEENTRIMDIRREIEDYLFDSPNIFQLFEDYNLMLIAWVGNIESIKVSNKNSFQPFESRTDSKVGLLYIIQIGEPPQRGEIAYTLIKRGCPVIKIRHAFEVYDSLSKIGL